jgi:hypothetical protein
VRNRNIYVEYLHLDSERKVTVCGVTVRVLGGVGKFHDKASAENPIELRKRIEFWKHTESPASAVSPRHMEIVK